MWVARIFQVVGLLLALAALFAVAFVSINFPLQEAESHANRAVGMAYMVIVAPIVLLYLLIGATSTLFLLSKSRRAAYGFSTGSWRSLFWANLGALLMLVGLPVISSLAFSLFALGT